MPSRSPVDQARRHRGLKVVTAVGALSVAGFLAATEARANSLHTWLCGQNNQWEGYSATSYGAETTDSDGDCGTVGLRVEYRTYSTSPLYTTGWYYGNPTVIFNPRAITEGGIHKVSDCGALYDCGPNYS